MPATSTQLGSKRFEERLHRLRRRGAFGRDLHHLRGSRGVDHLRDPAAHATSRRRSRASALVFPDDTHLVARQRMSVGDAIKAYTINGAWQLRLEDQIGSIEVGKKADLIVLGADLFEVDPYDIHRVPVLLTLVDGKVRHDKLAS